MVDVYQIETPKDLTKYHPTQYQAFRRSLQNWGRDSDTRTIIAHPCDAFAILAGFGMMDVDPTACALEITSLKSIQDFQATSFLDEANLPSSYHEAITEGKDWVIVSLHGCPQETFGTLKLSVASIDLSAYTDVFASQNDNNSSLAHYLFFP
jgi:hypothetical protein